MEDGIPFGRYRLLEVLGRGGMGEVWRAFDTVTDRVVALKVLPTQLADDAVYQERFRREARSAAGLDEPHIVPIHDFGEIDGRLFVTMRLIKGRDLHSIIRDGRLDSARAVGIVDQVASALHAAHQVDLIHRDVKPSNILVGDDDFAYLIDFGIARAAGQSGLTDTSSVIGTWAYMAPERVTAGQADARADVYALACVLYECLTGSQPFPGDSIEQQIGGHVAMTPPRASERHPDVPAGLDAVIAKGMAKNPDERYSTTRELAHAAKTAVTGPIPLPRQAPTTISPDAATSFANRPADPQRPTDFVANRAAVAQGPANDPTQYRAAPPPPPPPPQYRVPQGPPSPPLVSPAPPMPPRPPDHQPPHQQPNPPSPKKSRKGLVIALAGVAIVAVAAVAATYFILPSRHHGTSGAAANTGPFTGAFSVAFGPRLLPNGDPAPDEKEAFTETWHLRSACGGNGCIATSSSGGKYVAKDVVFDKVGDSWLGVSLSSSRCRGVDAEAWNAISVQPQPNGTLTGEYTQSTTNGCANKRTVTFARTGDIDVASLPDPATEKARITSPAEQLLGTYHDETVFPDGAKDEHDDTVRTFCLRAGDRCISHFIDVKGNTGKAFVFADGNWSRNSENVATKCTTGGNHVISTAMFPLPQPPQNPIALLSGHGHEQNTNAGCKDTDFTETFTRTGN